MRRTAFILLTLALTSGLLSGCGEKVPYSEVSAGIQNTNAIRRYNASFIAEMTFENETATLLYQQGSYSIDRDAQQLYAEYVRTYLGASDKVTEMYKDGYVYLSDSSGKTRYESKPEFLGYLQYAEALDFNEKDVSNLKKSKNSSGTLYTFKVKSGYDEQLKTLLGDNIYSLAKIAKPQKDKTHFSEIECEYTFTQDKNGQPVLATRQIMFTVYLYDTPAYTPGHTPKEEDYRLDLKVRIRVTYKVLENIEISEPVTTDYNEIS